MFQTYKTYFKFLSHYPYRFIAFAVSLLTLSIVENILPYFLKLFTDAITTQAPYPTLLNILLAYIGIRVLIILIDLITFFTGDYLHFAAGRDARLTIFRKLQHLDFAYHTSKSTGALISMMKRGDTAFFDLFHDLIINTTRILIGLVVAVFFLNQIGFTITCIMLVSFIINIIAANYLIRYNVKTRTNFNKSEDNISSIIVDNLINYETVKLFAKENWEYNRITHQYKDWTQKLWAFANSFRLIDIVIGLLGNTGLFLVLIYSIGQVSSEEISAGQFILILGFINQFYPKFFDLIYKLRNLAKHYTDLNKYFQVLALETQITDPTSPVQIKDIAGEIEFKNVTFTYPDTKQPALKNFNLKIRQGQSVALVGTSGGGKSTVIKLLLRFFDPDSGQILLDGHDIKTFTKSQLRSYMGIVPQEPILFNNSIAFNVAYGSPELPYDQKISELPTKKRRLINKEIKAALKKANLDTFLTHLPQGLETNVGERGIKLSGGQKQRLAIARMILANPRIIIFDEATSALDSNSEKLVQEAFKKASHDKTTIVIAHRLSTITHVDKIVVLKNGQVVEEGSHRDLIHRSNSHYKKFWDLQTNQ